MCSVVSLIGRHAVKARVRAAAIVQRDDGAHRTEERQVLYAWHPWFGRIVHIHEVIQKTAGDVFRCSCDDEASGRWLELPAWMFDRSVCAPMQVCAPPFVGVTALGALRVLLSDLAGNREGIIGGSSNAPVPGAALGSPEQTIGERPMQQENKRHHQHRGAGEQFDLFRRPCSGGTRQPPAWEALPPQTRATLTELMMRLILDHGRPIAATPRRGRCAMSFEKIRPHHLERKAILYVRQSSSLPGFAQPGEPVRCNTRCATVCRHWAGPELRSVDDDLGRSAAGGVIARRFRADGCGGLPGQGRGRGGAGGLALRPQQPRLSAAR